MNPQILITVLATTSVVVMLSALILARRRNRGLQTQLVQLEEQLQQTSQASESFSQDLVQAEKSRTIPRPHKTQELPDRYRYISAMARQGISAIQIAAALQIGEAEAAQIVRLSRLNNCV